MLHQIGVGALGPVFRTYDPARDRLVAVKAFRLDIIPEQAQALAAELNKTAQAGLFHPSIVEPISAGVEGTVAYLAEEYIAAESLDIAMRHYAGAGVDKALPFLAQLAGAVDFARSVGVGHGGLHPRDVFVSPDEARATGFGVVEALERVGIRAPVRRPYSAPERIAGEAWSTPADVFALAAIAFELLTGRRPAGTGDQIGALDGAHAGPHADALWGVLARAMADDPSRRYAAALAFASALEAAARGERDGSVVAAPHTSAVEGRDKEVRDKEDAGDKQSAGDTESAGGTEDAAGTAIEADKDREVAFAARTLFDEPHLLTEAAEYPDEDETVQVPRDRVRAPVATATGFGDLGQQGDPFDPADEFSAEEPAERPFGHEPRIHAPAPPRSSSGVLPIAVTLVLGLLLGFGAGYFEGHRDRGIPATVVTAEPTTPPGGAATGGSSAVTPPSPSAAPSAPIADAAAQPPRKAPAADRPAPPVVTSGRLVVRSTPSRAGVTLNGRWRGRTPLTLDALALGHYVVRVIQDGYHPDRQEVTLSPQDAEHVVDVRLERQPVAETAARRSPARPAAAASEGPFTGSLFVDSRPQGARVMLDGTIVGKTPLVLSAVRIGAHVVRLELDEHHPWSAATTIVAGQETRVTGSLERFR